MNYNVVGTNFGTNGKSLKVPPTMKGKKGIKEVSLQEYKENPEEFIVMSCEVIKGRDEETSK